MTTIEGGGHLIVVDQDRDKGEVRSAVKDSPVITDWMPLDPHTYECCVWLSPEDDGRFSIWAPLLPGVASQGDTEAEALANVTEAFQGVVETYRDYNEPIPWLDPKEVGERPVNAKEKRILVNV